MVQKFLIIFDSKQRMIFKLFVELTIGLIGIKIVQIVFELFSLLQYCTGETKLITKLIFWRLFCKKNNENQRIILAVPRFFQILPPSVFFAVIDVLQNVIP